MKIKDLPLEDRPREKLFVFGARHLADSELLAIILGTGTKDNNAVETAQRLLNSFGVQELAGKSIKELCRIRGIGRVKAAKLLACFELAKRVGNVKPSGRQIENPENLAPYLIAKFSGIKQENFTVFLLDSRNKIIKEEVLFIGTLNETIIHPREIFNLAIKESAASIIIVHNHPSGDPTPSFEDIKLTKDLVKVGKFLEIELFDHIIVGDLGFVSLEQAGII